jgi:2-oxoglutarate ferredoxin oxidoreductase subunit beta
MDYYIDNYLRHLPTNFCAGCGNGIILNCFVRVVDDLELDLNKILCVSGIGCSSWIPSPYFKSDTLHGTHGRALAFATGAKVFNNDLTVVVFTGDGDGAGIGGNHLIHAARRNIDVTMILVNNLSYAMTGGQLSPTTFYGVKTITSPYGNFENPFDLCRLVQAAGASYVSRWSTFHVRELRRSIKEALTNRGFSFIEVLSQCPIQQKNFFSLREVLPYEIPTKILEIFLENTYIRDTPREENYFYVVPREEIQSTEKKISKILTEKAVDFESHIVTRLFLGNVIKIMCKDIVTFKKSLNIVKTMKIGHILDARKGKIVLGNFTSKKKKEAIDQIIAERGVKF